MAKNVTELERIADAVDALAGVTPGGGGSSAGVMAVKKTYDETTDVITIDHTWQEMYDSIANGVPVLCCYEFYSGGGQEQEHVARTDLVSLRQTAENEFTVVIGEDEYTCTDPDDYPADGKASDDELS